MSTVKPMLAVKVEDGELDKLRFPFLAQPKIDGIRCIVLNGVAYSRKLKPIRNTAVQEACRDLSYFDGELTAHSVINFQETTSVIMTDHHDPNFIFHAFDIIAPPMQFKQRYEVLKDWAYEKQISQLQLVESVVIRDIEMLREYEEYYIQKGYEGVILRRPDGLYKYGRSTLNESYLIKRKPFVDEEAFIIGFGEQEENLNPLEQDNLGYAKRSSAQSNKVGKDTLGYFRVRSARWGEFNIGTGLGLTDNLRKEIWENRDRYMGRCITFKYQKFGTKDKPRQPIFLRFRHEEDMVDL